MWKEALSHLLGHKLLWAGETGLLASALAVTFAFLTLPVAKWWQLALHAVCFAALGGILFVGWWWARREMPPRPMVWSEPLFAAAVLVWAVAGLWLPWRVIWWVPAFDSLRVQAASAVARFALAGILFTGASLWLAACRKEGE